MKKLWVITIVLLGLSGCSTPGGYAFIDRLQVEHGWSVKQSGDLTTPFLEAYREGDSTKPNWVYNEGDGSA